VSRQLGQALPLAFVAALVTGCVAFAAVEDRTRELTLADRAEHVAGADVRVLVPPDAVRAGPQAEREELSGLPAVTSVGGLHRELRFVDDVAVELVVADVQEAALAPLVDGGRFQGGPMAGGRGDAVPALVTPGLVEDAGLAPGTLFELPVEGVRTAFEVVGTVPGPATVDPARESVLVDRAALGGVTVDEWWLAVRAGSEAEVAETLAGRPELARAALTPVGTRTELLQSPETGGVALSRVLRAVGVGTVTVGVVALVAVALLRRAERRRWSDFLRALGASRRDVGLTLTVEHALVTGGGCLVGLVAGAVTAVLTVAASPVTGAPTPVVAVSAGAPWTWLVVATSLLVAVPLLALGLVRGGPGERR
jgi:hypothetical protein